MQRYFMCSDRHLFLLFHFHFSAVFCLWMYVCVCVCTFSLIICIYVDHQQNRTGSPIETAQRNHRRYKQFAVVFLSVQRDYVCACAFYAQQCWCVISVRGIPHVSLLNDMHVCVYVYACMSAHTRAYMCVFNTVQLPLEHIKSNICGISGQISIFSTQFRMYIQINDMHFIENSFPTYKYCQRCVRFFLLLLLLPPNE